MNASLTVVLPIHNAESSLREHVGQLLEVASDLTPSFELLVFDDGSTDDSYDIANELATRYPQVRVARHSRRRGMGPTLRSARRRASGELVIVHDGASPINAEQIGVLYRAHASGTEPQAASIDDLRLPARSQAAMDAAHARLMGFSKLDPAPSDKPDAAVDRSAAGIGSIPSLPRPNFLGAIGEFALGE